MFLTRLVYGLGEVCSTRSEAFRIDRTACRPIVGNLCLSVMWSVLKLFSWMDLYCGKISALRYHRPLHINGGAKEMLCRLDGHLRNSFALRGSCFRAVGLPLLAFLGLLLVAGCSSSSSAPADVGGSEGLAADSAVDSDSATPIADSTKPVDQSLAEAGQVDQSLGDGSTSSVPGTWKPITAGTFQMGSPATELCRLEEERQHKVILTHDFEIQTTEVTQEQFQAVMGRNPSVFNATHPSDPCGKKCPVENLKWFDAVAYCNALSVMAKLPICYACSDTGGTLSCEKKGTASIYDCKGYRLPTEAEWEYAYRAGSTTAYYNGNGGIVNCSDTTSEVSAIAWYTGDSGDHPHEVAKKAHNAWGLYDMAGNVWEWCHDWHEEYPVVGATVTNPEGPSVAPSRMLRGGSFFEISRYHRAAGRQNFNPDYEHDNVGFRCVRSL